MEPIAAFDPKLDRLEPQAEAAPEIGPSQRARSGRAACDLRGALLERCGIRQLSKWISAVSEAQFPIFLSFFPTE